jgi:phosphoribosylformimino-5-aminoimidazole carboxamide ribotide isomerase
MIFFPAIDIKEGKVVRLAQGDYHRVTEYASGPLDQAKSFAKAGATWLHVVDLDAAKAGRPVNARIIQELTRATGLQVQIGGGIRSLEMAQTYLDGGVSRVVVGTQAVVDPGFLAQLGQAFPGKVALGLDTKAGQIAIQGWTETVPQSLAEYMKEAPLEGVACLIFTDIARDGMLTGPNLESLRKALEISPIPVIASGGIAGLEDLKSLVDLKHPNLWGVISGRALYEGRLSLQDALELFKDSC